MSSFAGGFVCNPDYLAHIANASGLPPFPRFMTKQRWQFGWAAWYSARFPTRPTQFTTQQPDLRVPFWGFPHSSVPGAESKQAVSQLYDDLIQDLVERLTPAPVSTLDAIVTPVFITTVTFATVLAIVGWSLAWRNCSRMRLLPLASSLLQSSDLDLDGNTPITNYLSDPDDRSAPF